MSKNRCTWESSEGLCHQPVKSSSGLFCAYHQALVDSNWESLFKYIGNEPEVKVSEGTPDAFVVEATLGKYCS